jgi:hypothetical protein
MAASGARRLDLLSARVILPLFLFFPDHRELDASFSRLRALLATTNWIRFQHIVHPWVTQRAGAAAPDVSSNFCTFTVS